MNGLKIHLAIIYIWIAHSLPAQDTAEWQWGVRMGGFFTDPNASAQDDIPTDMAVDSFGNVFICGYSMTPTITADSSFGNARNTDGYIVSYDCKGNFRWLHLFGSEGNDRTSTFEPHLTLDENQNIYLTGVLMNRASTKASISDSTFSGLFIKGFIVAKYSNSGKFQWVKKGNEEFDAVKLLGYGNNGEGINYHDGKLVSLFHTDSVEIYPGIYLNSGLYLGWHDTLNGELDKYQQIIKDTFTRQLWQLLTIDGMTVDSKGNIVIGFNIEDTVEIGGQMFYPDPTMISVIKFNPQGQLLWHFDVTQNATLSNANVIYGLSVDSNDNIYFVGTTLDGEVIGDDTIQVQGNVGSIEMVTKLNASGDHEWTQHPVKSNSVSRTQAIHITGDSGVWTTGFLSGNNFYLTDTISRKSGNFDPFILQYTMDGSLLKGMVLEGIDGDNDLGMTLSSDAIGNLYIGGAFNNKLVLGNDTLRSEGGLSDVFIAKYGSCRCPDTSDPDDTTGVRALHPGEANIKLRIAPNPARTSVTVTLLAPQHLFSKLPALQLIDINGRMVRSKINPSMMLDARHGKLAVAYRVDVSSIESGVYVIRAITDQWKVSGKLILKRAEEDD